MVESIRQVSGKRTREPRCYISSLPPDPKRIAGAIPQHWGVENQLHGCLDVTFGDDQMRARTAYAGHNLAILKRLTLKLIRLDPKPRRGGLKIRRASAATSDEYRAYLLGLK